MSTTGSDNWDPHHSDIDVTIPPASSGDKNPGNATIVVQNGTSANANSQVVMSIAPPSFPNGATWTAGSSPSPTTWIVQGNLFGGATVNFTLTQTNTGTSPTNPTPTISPNGLTTTYSFAAASGGGTTQIIVTMNPSGGGGL